MPVPKNPPWTHEVWSPSWQKAQRAVRVRERHDDHIADLHRADVGADGLDDTYGLMSHAAAGLVVFHRVVRPEIAAADAGAGDFDQGIGRLY